MKTNRKVLGRGLDALIPAQTVAAKTAESEVKAIARANIVAAATAIGAATEGMTEEESKKMIALIVETGTWMLATGRR